MSKILFGGRKTVKVEVQNHRKIVLIGSFKEVAYTLRNLSNIFGRRPIGRITDAELITATQTSNNLRRRICGR